MTLEEKDPSVIEPMFTIIAGMLSEPLLYEKAEKAFLKGCQHNPLIVSKNFNDFIKLLQLHTDKPLILKGILSLLNDNKALMTEHLKGIFEIYTSKFKQTREPTKLIQTVNALSTIVAGLKDAKQQYYLATVKEMYEGIM